MFATLSLQDERSKVPKVIVTLRLDRQKANIRHMGDGFPAMHDRWFDTDQCNAPGDSLFCLTLHLTSFVNGNRRVCVD